MNPHGAVGPCCEAQRAQLVDGASIRRDLPGGGDPADRGDGVKPLSPGTVSFVNHSAPSGPLVWV